MDEAQVIWGDLITTRYGSAKDMTYAAADTYCKSIGAKVPSENQFRGLLKFLGRDKLAYRPEILPHFGDGNFLWMSPSGFDDARYGAVFYDNEGVLMPSERSSLNELRCVLEAK